MGYNIACSGACIGCRLCVRICPGNWRMVGRRAAPRLTELERLGLNRLAAEHCPMGCIEINGA